MTMRKMTRSMMPTWKLRKLQEQNGLCLLCGLTIDTSIKGEGVVDHDHSTGEIRGILHRSCNAAEGKVANAAGHWGAKSMDQKLVARFLRRLLAYWELPGTGWIYPTHKTEDEKRDVRNAKERERRAQIKARKAVALANRQKGSE